MRSSLPISLYTLLVIFVLFSFSCEKKKEYAICSPICDNYDTVNEFINAKINGELHKCNDAALYKVNGNELLDKCLYSIMGDIGTDSSISISFIGDTSIKTHIIMDNVEYYNIGVVNILNKENINLTKRYSSSVFSNGSGIEKGEVKIDSIKDCRVYGSFNFIGIDTKNNDSINVTDGKFSVRLF